MSASRDQGTLDLRSIEQLTDTATRVLVVDDDESVLGVLTDFLHDMGYFPVTAQNGLEAVEKIIEEQFDLILLDLMMPMMSGQDTFEMIRSVNDGVPIIIITGYGSIENAVEFVKNGAVDYLTKPVLLEEFRFRIMRAFEEKRLKEEAITDLKTQLFNHHYFMRRLKEELGRAERYDHDLSLLMLDLDNFKHYNDTFGHLAGDAVLRQVGTLLKKIVRDCDIPCRFGGEEFCVILPETGSAGAIKAAERIRSHVEKNAFREEPHELPKKITVSIGVATHCPDKGNEKPYTMNALIENADKALYEAKWSGKNKVCLAQPEGTDFPHN